MQFRDLKRQYQRLKPEIDAAVSTVLEEGNYISGRQVGELEQLLAEYVGVKHCIACANGTDALEIALMAMGVGKGDAVFVPDFTFFASAEAPAHLGATPIFVDIEEQTFNLDAEKLETAIETVVEEGILMPKVIVAVDLFGITADYDAIRKIAEKYNMLILEDGAQGFGAKYHEKMACSFGDISTTSFFPAKPLGCYGDGGAIFTDNDEYATVIRSLCVHGKGSDKYHNVRIGTNSRLDTVQAVILIEKLKAFRDYELDAVNVAAQSYSEGLKGLVQIPMVPEGYYSSWAQYTIRVKDAGEREQLQKYLKQYDIPSNVYYPMPMHAQKAFEGNYGKGDTSVAEKACNCVMSIPIGPYITKEEVELVCEKVKEFYGK